MTSCANSKCFCVSFFYGNWLQGKKFPVSQILNSKWASFSQINPCDRARVGIWTPSPSNACAVKHDGARPNPIDHADTLVVLTTSCVYWKALFSEICLQRLHSYGRCAKRLPHQENRLSLKAFCRIFNLDDVTEWLRVQAKLGPFGGVTSLLGGGVNLPNEGLEKSLVICSMDI
jgi:hypothetical protein